MTPYHSQFVCLTLKTGNFFLFLHYQPLEVILHLLHLSLPPDHLLLLLYDLTLQVRLHLLHLPLPVNFHSPHLLTFLLLPGCPLVLQHRRDVLVGGLWLPLNPLGLLGRQYARQLVVHEMLDGVTTLLLQKPRQMHLLPGLDHRLVAC